MGGGGKIRAPRNILKATKDRVTQYYCCHSSAKVIYAIPLSGPLKIILSKLQASSNGVTENWKHMLSLKKRKIKNQLSKDFKHLISIISISKNAPRLSLCSSYLNRLILQSIIGTKTLHLLHTSFINFTLATWKGNFKRYCKLLGLQCCNFLCECLLLNSKDCTLFQIT